MNVHNWAFCVQSFKEDEVVNMEKETVDFLCEVVRFEKSIRKQLKGQQLEITKKKKIQMAYGHMDKMIQRYCDFLHVEVPEYEGLEFEIGLPVDPLNLEDFEEADTLYIETMLEPVIKEKGTSRIIRNGKAILAIKK